MKLSLGAFKVAIRVGAVALLSGASVVFGAQWLIHELNTVSNEPASNPIAKLSQREGVVRRKRAHRFLWTQAKVEEKFHHRESLMTSDESHAVVNLIRGGSIEIDSNSLVIFDEAREIPIHLVDGRAIVHMNNRSWMISNVDGGGVRTSELPVALIAPQITSKVFTAENSAKKVKFEWSAPPGGVKVKSILISGLGEMDLPKPTQQKTGDKKSASAQIANTLVIEVPPGKYTWNVQGYEGPLSPPSRFEVVNVTPLVPRYPEAQSKIPTQSAKKGIGFRWNRSQRLDVESLGQHTIEISSSKTFKSDVIRANLDPNQQTHKLNNLGAGEKFWRLVSHYDDTKVASVELPLSVIQVNDSHLQLVSPRDGEVLDRQSAVEFSWSSDLQEVEFALVVETHAGATVHSETTAETRAFWRGIKPGQYRWRVEAQVDGESIIRTNQNHFKFNPAQETLIGKLRNLLDLEEDAQKNSRSLASRLDSSWKEKDKKKEEEKPELKPVLVSATLMSPQTVKLLWTSPSELQAQNFSLQFKEQAGSDFSVIETVNAEIRNRTVQLAIEPQTIPAGNYEFRIVGTYLVDEAPTQMISNSVFIFIESNIPNIPINNGNSYLERMLRLPNGMYYFPLIEWPALDFSKYQNWYKRSWTASYTEHPGDFPDLPFQACIPDSRFVLHYINNPIHVDAVLAFSTERTIIAWFKPAPENSNSSNVVLFGDAKPGTGAPRTSGALVVKQTPGEPSQLEWLVNSGTGQKRYYLGEYSLQPNWTHFVVQQDYKFRKLKVWINGTLFKEITNMEVVTTAPEGTHFGFGEWGKSVSNSDYRPFIGKMAHLAIIGSLIEPGPASNGAVLGLYESHQPEMMCNCTEPMDNNPCRPSYFYTPN